MSDISDRKVREYLYRLFTARRRLERYKKELNAPEMLVEHAQALVNRIQDALEGLGFTGEGIENALREHWLDFEGGEMAYDKLMRCQVYKAVVQTRIMLGVPVDHPAAFECGLSTNCSTCECFVESTDEQTANFLNGCHMDTGERIPGFDIPGDDK